MNSSDQITADRSIAELLDTAAQSAARDLARKLGISDAVLGNIAAHAENPGQDLAQTIKEIAEIARRGLAATK